MELTRQWKDSSSRFAIRSTLAPVCVIPSLPEILTTSAKAMHSYGRLKLQRVFFCGSGSRPSHMSTRGK